MPFRPLQWARQTVGGRQDNSDGASLTNFYAVNPVSPEDAKSNVIIYGTPGHQKWLQLRPKTFTPSGGSATTPQDAVQGMISIDSPRYGKRLFAVLGGYQLAEVRVGTGANDLPQTYDPFTNAVRRLANTRIYQITEETDNILGYDADIGGHVPVRLATDGRRIVMVGGRNFYAYDMRDAEFKAVVAPTPEDQSAELPDEEWVDVMWSDGYFILLARGGQIFHSLLNSLQFNQLDFGSASAGPDPIVGGVVFNRRLYIMGSKTIEQFYNAGATIFAYERDNSFIADIGAASAASIQANEVGVFFLGSDGIVYMMTGPSIGRISHEGIEYEIARSDLSKARAFTYTEEGHRFYSLTIMDTDGGNAKNWTLDITTRFWHRRTLTDVLASEEFQGETMLGRASDNHMFAQKLDIGAHDGAAIRREAISPVIHANRQRFRQHSFEADIARRHSFSAEETIAMSFSDDNKQTWKRTTTENPDGQPRKCNQTRIRWTALGQSRNRHIRLVSSTTTRTDIIGAYTEFDMARN